MCGICLILEQNDQSINQQHACNDRLYRRGPDRSQESVVHISPQCRLKLTGHVLHLRGQLTRQPLCNDRGDYLLWNGEIFGGIQVKVDENDTRVLLDLLSLSEEPKHILDTMATVQGPWSFVYWQNSKKQLWFGRDVFGRRSLLWHLPESEDDTFILSSVRAYDKEFNEVPSVGIFCITFSGDIPSSKLHIKLYPRGNAVWPGTMEKVDSTSLSTKLYPNLAVSGQVTFEMDNTLLMTSAIPRLNKCIPEIEVTEVKVENHKQYVQHMLENDELMSKLADQLREVLLQAVKKRVYNQTYLKERTDQYKDGEGERGKSKEGNNSMFDKVVASTSKISVNDGLGSEVITSDDDNLEVMCEDDKPQSQLRTSKNDSDITDVPAVSDALSSCSYEKEAKVAILFSGGIDSAVIAALVDRCLPVDEPIDLINVAFEQQPKSNPKKGKVHLPEGETYRWKVPDRETGRAALAELSPQRTWNFVEVNVTLQELKQIRSTAIRHLVYPLDTVLDDSIGSAVWFAARGQGIIGNGEHCGKSYTSTAKVILCGMGADEQFAGYSRHRGKYQENGWKGLLDEIEMEVTRISARNLGRDDRVITDHGKESRFPFLDEDVVSFLQQLPIHHKTNLNLPRGLGEKLLLRLCATKLGLFNTAVFPKRAIQFGSRIAKIENNKERASDKCSRLTD